MEEDDDKDDSKRKSRNLSEKKRRDQFNMLVNELSTMVSTSGRKMDKSTVLKFAISFLKNHNEVTVQSRGHEIQEDWKPSFLSNEEFTHLILEAVDGFIMVFSASGKIFYASESITSLLGHLPSDLLNTSIYELVYDDDKPGLFNLLQNPTNTIDLLNGVFDKDSQVAFSCHLKRGCLDFREGPSYELIQFIGYFRTNVDSQEIDNLSPNSRATGDFEDSDTRLIFVCTGRLQTPQLIREMSVVDPSKSEFTSRHSLEWKFLFLDHRAPPIIGYLPFEVLGTSGYDYYHFDDLENVVTCHEALMKKGEGTSCYYRFLTKGQQWIWLQTRFYITYHQWNSKPEFVVCTHRVVSYFDVINNIQRTHEPDDSEPSNNPNRKSTCNPSQSNLDIVSLQENNSIQDGSWQWASKNSKHTITLDESRPRKPFVPSSFNVQSSGAGSDTASMSAGSISSRHSTGTHHSANQMHEQEVRPYRYKCSRSKSVKMSTPAQGQGAQGQGVQGAQGQGVQGAQGQGVQGAQGQGMQGAQGQGVQGAQVAVAHYLEPQQFLTVPVQPVIGFPQLQPLQPLPTSPDMDILITPSQVQMQEQLQKKHEELQQMIIHQQEELRRVSEQLFMARYGLLPPIINVTLPFNGPGITSGNLPADSYNPSQLQAMPQRPMLNQGPPQHMVTEYSDYIPMQMSQQQAQLLFSSTTHNPVNNTHPDKSDN